VENYSIDLFIALRNANGQFLLNGHYQVSVFRQQIDVLDTVLEYSGSEHIIERINGTGPIRMDIYLHILSVGNLYPPDIRYEYMLPTVGYRSQHQPLFNWRISEQWSDCSMICQGIYQSISFFILGFSFSKKIGYQILK
jgi:hypothetical protein